MSLILDTMFERYFILSFLKSIVVGGQRLQAVAPPPADDDAEEHMWKSGAEEAKLTIAGVQLAIARVAKVLVV
jgi:hypothetical protein